MTVTFRSKTGLILPTKDEEAAINKGIAEDPDTYELSDDEFAQLRPYRALELERQRMMLDEVKRTLSEVEVKLKGFVAIEFHDMVRAGSAEAQVHQAMKLLFEAHDILNHVDTKQKA